MIYISLGSDYYFYYASKNTFILQVIIRINCTLGENIIRDFK
tara:strand:- start:1541 stop:1666 length:126 start_codon:yes stop_codon:yes gene_type:complete